jgi:Spy/CpxP family protein refolding chaperone
MKTALHAFLLLISLTGMARAQYPDPMGRDPSQEDFARGRNVPAGDPLITMVELRGPLPTAEFQRMFKLTETQAIDYDSVYMSFIALTRADRAEANRRMEQLGTAVTKRDSAAVQYYAEYVKDLGKRLRNQQSKFDDQVKKLLDKDQQKEYKSYRKKQDEAARARPEPSK